MVPSLTAKSSAGNGNDVLLWADPATHGLLISGSITVSGLAGSKSTNAAAPTSDNIGALVGVANAAAPTYTEGNQVLLSTDLSGQLRVTGSLSVGGTVDGATFTAGSSTGTPTMGAYHSVIDTVTDGHSAIVAIDSKRSMHTSLYDAAGNALLGSKVSAGSIPVVIASDQGAVPVSLSGSLTVVGAAASGAAKSGNPVQVGAVFNTTQPTVTTGQVVEAQATARGARIVGVGVDGFAVTIAAGAAVIGHVIVDSGVITTVSAVTAITNALPAGTNLMGKVGIDQTTVGTTNGISLAQIGATTVATGNGVTGAGVQRVTISSDNSAVSGFGAGATGAVVPANAVYQGIIAKTANPTAATDGNTVGAMGDKLGRQVVVIGNVRDNKANAVLTLTASTTETSLIAAIASTFNDVYGVIIENTSATATEVVFRDSLAGTVQFSFMVPAGETRGFMLPSSDGFKQTTVNTAWTAQCTTSVSSVKITALYVKNI